MIFDRMTRKEKYDSYQETARRLYQDVEGSQITVDRNSDVKMIEGGAYVSAVIWIPQEAIDNESPTS
jgi:hypothetical protein